MYNSILNRVWYRIVEWWMHRHGAENIDVEYMDKEFTIPVYPLTVLQQARLRRATYMLEDDGGYPGDKDVFQALTMIQNLAADITEYKVADFPTELLLEILSKAPKEEPRS